MCLQIILCSGGGVWQIMNRSTPSMVPYHVSTNYSMFSGWCMADNEWFNSLPWYQTIVKPIILCSGGGVWQIMNGSTPSHGTGPTRAYGECSRKYPLFCNWFTNKQAFSHTNIFYF